ncbi:MAG TPA: hypothetical protein VF727_15015 [Allosphingosinicella sp.]|jgi:hypothetical protein
MMKPVAALALGLAAAAAGCGAGGQQAGNGTAAATGANTVSPQPRADAPAGGPAGSTEITGLYEGGSPARRDQLCIAPGKGGEARFGLLVWGQGMYSCSGAGEAVRKGSNLTLRMTGDSPCEIDATLEGGTITLPQSLPSGCSYYCASSARLEGARLIRTGASLEAAMKARDFTGDPLCEG